MSPNGFIVPAQPATAAQPPSGLAGWHEIKYDGFQIMAWWEGERVRLLTRN
jgi:ATP-dependent DNA ligase